MIENDKKALEELAALLTDALNHLPGKNIARLAAERCNALLGHMENRLTELAKKEAAAAAAAAAAAVEAEKPAAG